MFPLIQISEGPNPAIEDLSPDIGNISIPVGKAVVQFTVYIQDDQVLNSLNKSLMIQGLWLRKQKKNRHVQEKV